MSASYKGRFAFSPPTFRFKMASAQVASSARQAVRAALHKARPSPTAALAKPVKKHEKLAKTLEWLNKEPKPILEKISSLELTYAYRNDHFGARYVQILVERLATPCFRRVVSLRPPGTCPLLTLCFIQTFRKGGTSTNRV